MVKDDAPELLHARPCTPALATGGGRASGNTDCYQPVDAGSG
jgi:hypothetical protein